jgi:hypothetical protein
MKEVSLKTNNEDYALKLENAIKLISEENQTIKDVFKELKINYKPKSYYAIKKRYDKYGLNGLLNKQGRPPKKSTPEIYELLTKLKSQDEFITGKKISKILTEKYLENISVSQINRLLQQKEISNKIGRPIKNEEIEIECAGAIIFTSAVKEIKYLEKITELQYQITKEITSEIKIPETEGAIYEEVGIFSKDEKGRFKKYETVKKTSNKNKEISNKFMSLQERKKNRNLKRTSINNTSIETLQKKNMTLLSLPIITDKSRIVELTNTKRNELKYISGYDYKYNTMHKYISELKYFEMSNKLLIRTGEFFYKLWEETTGEKFRMICCYFDGHKKALWSSVEVLKSKVTKTGRIMGCLEHVFVHSSSGHPILLQTFPGGIYLPKAINELQEKLNEFLPEVDMRISIFDGGGNSVEYFQSFTNKNYYICILDNNQYKNDLSNFEIISKKKSNGEEFIEAEKELTNSKTKPPSKHLTRTPLYKKDGDDKYIAFATNIPSKELSAEEIIRMYYKRWPYQEFNFRDMNMGAGLSTNYGCGKMKITNFVVRKKIKFLKESIEKRQGKIAELNEEISKLEREKESIEKQKIEVIKSEKIKIKNYEKEIHNCIDKKFLKELLKKLKEANKIITKNEIMLKTKILQINVEIKKIKTIKETKEKFLKKEEKECERVKKKEIVYRNDVELEQIMGMYKIAFTNICAYILKKYFSGLNMSMDNLIKKVFTRPGKMVRRGKEKIIYIYLNNKDKQMDERIKSACEIINSKEINKNAKEVIILKTMT